MCTKPTLFHKIMYLARRPGSWCKHRHHRRPSVSSLAALQGVDLRRGGGDAGAVALPAAGRRGGGDAGAVVQRGGAGAATLARDAADGRRGGRVRSEQWSVGPRDRARVEEAGKPTRVILVGRSGPGGESGAA